jgi:hypothetical protein
MCEENREEKGKGNPRRLSSVRWGLRAAHVICRWAPTVSGVVVRARSHGALAGVPRPAPALNAEVSGRLVWPGRIHYDSNPVGGWDRAWRLPKRHSLPFCLFSRRAHAEICTAPSLGLGTAIGVDATRTVLY